MLRIATVHLYTPKNESVTDFYIEAFVNNVSAGKFMSADKGFLVNRRARPGDDFGQKSKQYGNEKTAWSQQQKRFYPMSTATAAGAVVAKTTNTNGIGQTAMAIRVDESGIDIGATTTNADANGPQGAKIRAIPSNKIVNRRRKRVDNMNMNNDARHCAERQMWSDSITDDVEHSVRRWIYNSNVFANETVSFR